jgi:hypothetical protein
MSSPNAATRSFIPSPQIKPLPPNQLPLMLFYKHLCALIAAKFQFVNLAFTILGA